MIKFVIWGAGHRCQEVVNFLGMQQIVAIVDNDESKQNTLFSGIRIISKEEYLRSFFRFPIIVTPLNAELAIHEYLLQNGVYWSFTYWGKNRCDIGCFMKQIPYDWLYNKCSGSQTILISGWNVLTILVYNYFAGRGLKSKIVLPKRDNQQLIEYISKVLHIPVVPSVENIANSIILLTEEDSNIKKNNNTVIPLYDLTLQKNLYKNSNLEKFHQKYANRRCFIVATGPSLKMEDLKTLNDNNELCISMNGIFKGYKDTPWRPDFYIVSDMEPIMENIEHIESCGKVANFIGDMSWIFEEKKDTGRIYKWHQYLTWNDNQIPEFSGDFSEGSYWGMTITYDALQLASYMGFKEIYLLGVDCCKYTTPETQHFIKNYRSKLGNIREKESIMSYTAAYNYADEHNIKIFNASRGGKLEVFERVDFDTLFCD